MQTPTLTLLRNAMTAYARRSESLASNLANLETPDYQRQKVSFEDSLQDARRRRIGEGRDVDRIRARVETDEAPPVLEGEMMELADTQMRTQLATRALSEHFGLLRTGILGRAM
jgi:flagellar basal-body rod protein FlgB